MSGGEVVYQRLTANAAVHALLKGRIYQDPAPERVDLPYLVYEEFDPDRFSCMGTDLDIVRGVVRLSLIHDDYNAGRALRELIRAALQRWRGTAGTVTVDDIFIQGGSPTTYDELKKAWNFQRDYEVIYRES